MNADEKRKPRLVSARDEVIIIEQPPPGPPNYELIDSWDGHEERRHRLPTKLLAVAIMAALAIPLLIAIPILGPQLTKYVTHTTTETITKTTTNTKHGVIILNATNIVLGSSIEIKVFMENRPTLIRAEIYNATQQKVNEYTLSLNPGADKSFIGLLQLIKLKPGIYKLSIKLDNAAKYDAILTILEPKIYLSSKELRVNDTVTVFGFNFNISQKIIMCIDKNRNNMCDSNESNHEIEVDSKGFFNRTLTIPAMPKDNYSLVAYDGLNYASAGFTVRPHLVHNSSFVGHGKGLNITGFGFGANKNLTIEICRQSSCDPVGNSSVNNNGLWSLTLNHEKLCTYGAGPYLVKVREENTEPVYYVCET